MLKKLQEKPSHIKHTISLLVTIVIFSGILFVWLSSRDARTRELEVREKTVSPISGVTSMFDGLVADFKVKLSSASPFVTPKTEAPTPAPMSNFDLSGVIIIDPTAASSTAVKK